MFIEKTMRKTIMKDNKVKIISISRILRAVFFVLSAGLMILFLSEIIKGYGRNIITISGFLLSLMVFTYTIFFHLINSWIVRIRNRNKPARCAVNVVITTVILCLAYVITATSLMIAYAYRKAPLSDRPPVVVVLGCYVADGQPSTLLSERIMTAYEYLSEHPECPCIVSGGQGDDESISEAECMYRELVNMGISSDRIYKEDRSTSTRENLDFSKEIMERENLGDTAVIVTNAWHELRASMIASDLDLPCGLEGASTPPWRLPSNYLRELAGIIYQLVF